ncbi:scarecrow 21 [Olea europaea subsp. europaea]|uniref:Scarecrow 21 n=1 Tax=Olea europaea subsp. europaea TaxID=158383 RepID=A0A8S0QGT7_OLEEU|nr:scarecrow 21 [Olea europaea subsp. europaea]
MRVEITIMIDLVQAIRARQSCLPQSGVEVTRDMLDVRPGAALAVILPLQLHHTPNESVDVSNLKDRLLRIVKSLSPKVVTLVEQESNTNIAFFLRVLRNA